MSDGKGKERREHPRTSVSWPVRIWVNGTVIVGRAIDISEHGLCLLAAPTGGLKRGESYRVEILVDADTRFSCQGEVRHMTDSLIGLRTLERFKLV